MAYQRGTVEATKGELGEQIVKDCLLRSGWKVIPSSDYCGPTGSRAPRLSDGSGFVAALPDIDIAKGGARRWVEVKYKTKRECYHAWGHRTVHGIALRSYESYRRVERETGTDVWLFIVEWEKRNVLSAPLSTLSQPHWHKVNSTPQANNEGGDIYFDIYAFRLFSVIPGEFTGGPELFELKDAQWRPITA